RTRWSRGRVENSRHAAAIASAPTARRVSAGSCRSEPDAPAPCLLNRLSHCPMVEGVAVVGRLKADGITKPVEEADRYRGEVDAFTGRRSSFAIKPDGYQGLVGAPLD